MELETTSQPLKNIVPAAQNNIDAKFILLDKGRVITLDGQHKTCIALVADKTAAVQCDAFEPGGVILLANGILSYRRNNLVFESRKKREGGESWGIYYGHALYTYM